MVMREYWVRDQVTPVVYRYIDWSNTVSLQMIESSHDVGDLVTLVADVHYTFMREYWVQTQSSPVFYRYIDWGITVHMLMMNSTSS